jgi:sortase A
MKKRKVIRIFAVILALFGSGTLIWIFYPIFLYQFTSTPSMTFLSPIPDEVQAQTQNNIDYTKASNWLPKAKEVNFNPSNTTSYKLSIPRLNIKKATVSIGGEDLSLSLIQYPGTATPGQAGNSVIFGHSVLPAFYDPKNYLTIFSTIPTLIKGDIITVDYDGITYKYQVEEKFEVEASDLQILDQDQSDSFLTLVTCVPPGLKTRRGVIKARIVPIRST